MTAYRPDTLGAEPAGMDVPALRQARLPPPVRHINWTGQPIGMSQPPFRIVLKTDPLTEEYLPPDFVARREQLREMLDLMTLTSYRGRGIVGWLHGPPGSGKSSTARWILHQLEERQVRTAFVNCWSHCTFFSVLEAILVDLGAMIHVTREVSFKFERLHAVAKKGPLTIVLDEVDQMLAKERNSLIYNLSRLPNAKVLCLTHSREPYVHLDPRVLSRVQPLFVHFSAYCHDDLVRILRNRAEQSLAPESWCLADLEAIAAQSQGDARIAIQALRTAAYLAEKHRSPQIRASDIREGIAKSSELRKKYAQSGLSEHHRVLYRIVADAGQIAVEDAWKMFVRAATEQRLPQMKRRTFNGYKQFLIVTKFIEEVHGSGRRNGRTLRVVK
jgi:archaeal cell division control protein 6